MDTSLIACMPDADAVVGRWRARFDPWAAHGIGAHITVASPFLPDDRVDAEVIARLSTIAARHRVVVSFEAIDQLPGAITFHPNSDESLTALTVDVVDAWPELDGRLRTGRSRPYHLTIACSSDPTVLRRVTSEIAPTLPLRVRASRLDVVAHDEERPRVVAEIPLANDGS
jgi:2'-5' RNA ligase